MKNLYLLFLDELNGFYKSGVMIVLWILLPLMGVGLYFLISGQTGQVFPGGGELPMTYLIGLIVSNIGAQITAVMLTVNIINERQKKVYDIFVIRPIRRSYLLLSKFFAVFLCVSLACVLAMFAGILVDTIRGDAPSAFMIRTTFESYVMSVGVIATLSAVGILFGVMADSIMVGVILILFLGGYATYFPALPPLMGLPNSTLWSLVSGAAATAGILALSGYLFNRKQM